MHKQIIAMAGYYACAAFIFCCHGNIKLKKNELFKWQLVQTTEAVGLLFGTNVAWLRTISKIKKFGGLPLGLVAMATESFRRHNGKMVQLHFLYNQ